MIFSLCDCINRRWLTTLDDDGPAFPQWTTQYQSWHADVTDVSCHLFKPMYSGVAGPDVKRLSKN